MCESAVFFFVFSVPRLQICRQIAIVKPAFLGKDQAASFLIYSVFIPVYKFVVWLQLLAKAGFCDPRNPLKSQAISKFATWKGSGLFASCTAMALPSPHSRHNLVYEWRVLFKSKKIIIQMPEMIRSPLKIRCNFFAYNWKLPAYNGAFFAYSCVWELSYLQLDCSAYNFSSWACNWAFLLTMGECM